jgi:hypothetical protein
VGLSAWNSLVLVPPDPSYLLAVARQIPAHSSAMIRR